MAQDFTPKKFTVRTCQPGDEKEIVDLLELVFNGWPNFDLEKTSLDYWRWKHEDSMVQSQTVAVGVNDEEKIVGCLHAPLVSFKIGKQVLRLYCGVDLAVHPDYRKQGMWNHMNEIIGEKYIAYNYSSNPIVKDKVKRMGRQAFPHPIKEYLKIRDIDEYSKTHEISFVKKTGLKIMKKMPTRKLEKNNSFNTMRISEFNENINIFWENLKSHYYFTTVKNREYLNNRFCDIRGGNYSVFLTKEGEEPLGYLVARINHARDPVGYIVELMTLHDRSDVVDELFFQADRYFEENNVNVSRLWGLKGSSLIESAGKHGYADNRRNIFVWFSTYTIEHDKILNDLYNTPVVNLNLQLGDFDII
jgi:hypothetical protein